MRHAFWKSCRILFRYKCRMAIAMVGVFFATLSVGAGIGMLMPIFYLLVREQKSLSNLIEQNITIATNPQFVQDIGHWLHPRVPEQPFAGFALVMGLLSMFVVMGMLGRYLQQMMMITLVMRVGMEWRSRIFRRLLHAPYVDVLRLGISNNITKLLFDVEMLCKGYQAVLTRGTWDTMRGGTGLVLALWLDWRLTLIALLVAGPIMIVLRVFGKQIRKATRRALGQVGAMIGEVQAALAGIAVVKTHNAEGAERRRFSRRNRELYAQELRKRNAQALANPLNEAISSLAVICVLLIAAWYIFRDGRSVEHYAPVLGAIAMLGASIKPLTQLYVSVKEADAAASRVLELLEQPVEPLDVEVRSKLPSLPPHHSEVIFDQVTFSYSGTDRPAIENVTLHVRHGMTVAVVGPNGSGKSTLLSLIPRLLSPASGRVLIDGIDIAGVNLRTLREQIAMVTQQTILFEGTIAQNIAFGYAGVEREKIIAAAKAAFADDFVSILPEGYDTKLGEGGTGLSGGQRQRLCIARAILRDPAILILDEATSQIDAESEAKINQAIRHLKHGRTTFVIAHRLSTVIDADLIVVMDHGRIADQGTHAELLARNSVYRALTHTQLQAHAS